MHGKLPAPRPAIFQLYKYTGKALISFFNRAEQPTSVYEKTGTYIPLGKCTFRFFICQLKDGQNRYNTCRYSLPVGSGMNHGHFPADRSPSAAAERRSNSATTLDRGSTKVATKKLDTPCMISNGSPATIHVNIPSKLRPNASA